MGRILLGFLRSGIALPHSGHIFSPDAEADASFALLGLSAAHGARLFRAGIIHLSSGRIHHDEFARRACDGFVFLVKRKHDRALGTNPRAGRTARFAQIGIADLHLALGIRFIHAEQAKLKAMPAIDAARTVDDRIPSRMNFFFQFLDRER